MMSGNTDGVWANAFNFHKYFDHIENDPIDQEKGGFEFGKSAATPLSQETSTWYPCGGGARSFACNVRCVKIAVK